MLSIPTPWLSWPFRLESTRWSETTAASVGALPALSSSAATKPFSAVGSIWTIVGAACTIQRTRCSVYNMHWLASSMCCRQRCQDRPQRTSKNPPSIVTRSMAGREGARRARPRASPPRRRNMSGRHYYIVEHACAQVGSGRRNGGNKTKKANRSRGFGRRALQSQPEVRPPGAAARRWRANHSRARLEVTDLKQMF